MKEIGKSIFGQIPNNTEVDAQGVFVCISTSTSAIPLPRTKIVTDPFDCHKRC